MKLSRFSIHGIKDAQDQQRNGCESCIRERLKPMTDQGSLKIHGFDYADEEFSIQLSYDEAQLNPTRIQTELRCAETSFLEQGRSILQNPKRTKQINETWRCVRLPVLGLKSKDDEDFVLKILNEIPGVMGKVSSAQSEIRLQVRTENCPMSQLVKAMNDSPYQLLLEQASACPLHQEEQLDAHQPSNQTPVIIRLLNFFKENPPLSFTLIGGLFLLTGFILSLLSISWWVVIPLLLISAVLTSTDTFPNAIKALKSFDLDVDVLMFVAAGGAFALGAYNEGVFLLFLFGLGAAGEDLALGRAKKAISALAEVAPESAHRLLPDGSVEDIPAEMVQSGDRIQVLPFERLPADGEISTGRSSVDQAVITGESIPVDKAPGDEVFAGTMNGSGRLVMVASKAASETTLARVIQLVEEAKGEQSPTEQITEQIEKYYVPAVFLLTILFIAIPPLLGLGATADSSLWELYKLWFYRSMAFLTAASPCALAIGTPAAVLCGLARSARIGVLIKGGGPLEELGRVQAFCFDKTGTLTEGTPTVTSILSRAEVTDHEILQWAASLEKQVNHPLAEAIVRAADHRQLQLLEAEDVEQITGIGVKGRVSGQTLQLSRLSPESKSGFTQDILNKLELLQEDGNTLVAVQRNDECLGFIAMADQARPESQSVIKKLRNRGIRKIMMLTGDHQRVATHMAEQIGIDEVFAELMPEDKLNRIEGLATQQRVAMIGDGVNDAPALAKAQVGIAIGGPGADVAMESADVVLMSGNVQRLPDLVKISRFSRRLIIQNLIFALGIIAVVAPLALLGQTSLGWAVVLHEGSTILVVLNALRILAVKTEKSVAPPEKASFIQVTKDGLGLHALQPCGDACDCDLASEPSLKSLA